MTKGRARTDGFSLIEVLGAIAILGIWFSIIAEMAMVGLRNEGRSHRMMLASLVADDYLSEIEIAMLQGNAPEFANEELERGDYTIRIQVEPYEFELPNDGSDRQSDARPFEHLAGDDPNAPSPIVSVRIDVAWFEGHEEQSVTRYTFAANLGQAQEALSSLRDPDDGEGLEGDDPLGEL